LLIQRIGGGGQGLDGFGLGFCQELGGIDGVEKRLVFGF
jgi:hypothetical protein